MDRLDAPEYQVCVDGMRIELLNIGGEKLDAWKKRFGDNRIIDVKTFYQLEIELKQTTEKRDSL